MLKKRRKKKGHRSYKIYIYEVCFKKIGSFFFCKVIVGYKNEIKGVIGDLKINCFFFNLMNDNSKNISRTFSGVVVDSVGSVHFHIGP